MLRLVGEGLEETFLVLLAVESDDECFGRGRRHSGRMSGFRCDELWIAYLSAWRTRMPVMRWVGMSDVSISTVNIWEVMDTKPPLLYKSCLVT